MGSYDDTTYESPTKSRRLTRDLHINRLGFVNIPNNVWRQELDEERITMKYVNDEDIQLMERQYELYRKEETEKAEREGTSRENAEALANRRAIQRVIEINAWQRYDDPIGGFMRILGLLAQDFVGPAINRASWYVVKTMVIHASSSLVSGYVVLEEADRHRRFH